MQPFVFLKHNLESAEIQLQNQEKKPYMSLQKTKKGNKILHFKIDFFWLNSKTQYFFLLF